MHGQRCNLTERLKYKLSLVKQWMWYLQIGFAYNFVVVKKDVNVYFSVGINSLLRLVRAPHSALYLL